MKILLVDNGSLEPAAVLALREVAARLAAKIGQPVFPVSLAYSDKIPAAALGGAAAQCVEVFLRGELEGGRAGGAQCVSAGGDQCASAGGDECASLLGERDFLILPFFIGPSRAVMQALPKLVEKLRAEFPDLRVRIAPVLHAAGADTLARILADRVRDALGGLGKMEPGKRIRVALVDHGSPVPEVTAVRDEVAGQLAALLASEPRVVEVAACSMERRAGSAYAFNEPLLETLLARGEWRESTVIVAQLFLLPGRHAGRGGDWCASAGGDIAQICARARERSPTLCTVQTEPLATHPLLVELLALRSAPV